MVTASCFPNPDTLCEDCGYVLHGLSAEGDCPECGLAIKESSPDRRTGPLWQDRPGPQAGFNIVIALMLNPKRFFRTMRVDGSNGFPRLFMLLAALGIGLVWFWLAWGLSNSVFPVWAVVQAGIVGASVVVLSYIEALGVAFFSRRRGWRVPMRLAERIVCYCSIAWAPAAGVMGIVLFFHSRGSIDLVMTRLLGTWEAWQSIGLMVLVGALAMLWFETLVWIGVRQTRHANSPPPTPPDGPGVENRAPGVET